MRPTSFRISTSSITSHRIEKEIQFLIN
jgi:hypothetical protein